MGENERKAAIATGIAVICVLFGVESAVAHHHVPSPLSWLVWTLLGAVGTASAVAAVFYRRRAGDEASRGGRAEGASGPARRDP